MLKLTFAQDNEQFLYVSAAAIFHRGSFWELPGIGSGVWVGKEFWVAETPEQILAMPEMQKVMSPLVSLPPSGTNHKSTTSWEYSHPFTTEVKGACVFQHCPNWRGH